MYERKSDHPPLSSELLRAVRCLRALPRESIVHEPRCTVCGEDHVGIGSDQSIQPFDTSPHGLLEFQQEEKQRHAAGIAAPEEDRPLYVVGLNRPDRCEGILKRGYPARVVEKVVGQNFVRVLSEIWAV
jgi:membrane dipeptidase